MRSVSLSRVSAAAALSLATGFSSAQGPGPSKVAAPLPLDLAYSMKTIRRYEQPALSRDGRLLAYEVYVPPKSSPEGQMEEGNRFLPTGASAIVVGLGVHVAETAGGKERAVCPEGANCWRPAWSPDGSRLAFYSDAGGMPQLWIYEVGSGKSRKLGETRIKAKHWPGDEAAWSPDGREVFVPVQLADHPVPAPPARKKSHQAGEPTASVYHAGQEAKAKGGADETRGWSHSLWENNATLAAIEVATGKLRVVVPAAVEPRPSCLRLSPDGKWISYLSVWEQPKEEVFELFYDLAVAPAAGGPVKVIASDLEVSQTGSYFGSTYRWRPGGSQIVFFKKKKLWLADVQSPAGTEPRQLAEKLGDLTDDPILMTRDGSAVLVGLKAEGAEIYYRVPHRALALVPLDGSEPKVHEVAGDPIQASLDTLWQPDPSTFFLVQKDEKTAQRSIARVDIRTGKAKTVWKGRGRFDFVGAGGDQRFAIARFESLDRPPDFYRFDESFTSPTRVTRVEPRLESIAVGPMENFQSSVPGFDGKLVTVESAAFLPPNRKPGEKLPTIVYFYGGSQIAENAQEYGGGAPNSIPVQVFATRGYAVLLVDVPLGPQGTGGNPIQEMADVILPQIYRAAQKGITDVNRVAIMGQSYGGYGTAAMVSQTNLFRAAIALAGIYDLPGFFGYMGPGGSNVFFWAEGGQGRMGSHPWGDLRRYLANSPYYLADKIHTPLLLIHGSEDVPDNAQRMFNALKRLDRTVQLAVYDKEGHVPGNWSLVNAVDATQRMLEFLERYVLARPGEKDEKSGVAPAK